MQSQGNKSKVISLQGCPLLADQDHATEDKWFILGITPYFQIRAGLLHLCATVYPLEVKKIRQTVQSEGYTAVTAQ